MVRGDENRNANARRLIASCSNRRPSAEGVQRCKVLAN